MGPGYRYRVEVLYGALPSGRALFGISRDLWPATEAGRLAAEARARELQAQGERARVALYRAQWFARDARVEPEPPAEPDLPVLRSAF